MDGYGRRGAHDALLDVDVDEARRLVLEIGGIKDQTRADFRDGTWQWLMVWAFVCAGAAASAFTPAAGWYWMLGAPIGLVATVIVSVRAESRARIKRKVGPYVVVSIVMGCVNGAISFAFEQEVVAVAIWVVLGFGFAALTSLDRVPTAPTTFLLLAVGTVVAGVSVDDGFVLYTVAAATFCVALMGFGVTVRRAAPR